MKHRSVYYIGTRQSPLAMAQAKFIQKKLTSLFPDIKFRIIKIKTYGDEFQSVEIFKKNSIGFFTKEIEKRLLMGQIDIAVHSLKDLPTDLAKGLMLGAVPKREDTRDVLICRHKTSLDQLPKNALVGTASPRRKRQLLLLRPDLRLVDLRGNLATRIKRVVEKKDLDAIVLAKAGLNRLNKYLRYASVIPSDEMYTAVGQAALGIQIRENDKQVLKIVKKLEHRISRISVDIERDFLRALQGGCRVPVGVQTQVRAKRVIFKAKVFSIRDSSIVSGQIHAKLAQASSAVQALARRILAKGAKSILSEARAE